MNLTRFDKFAERVRDFISRNSTPLVWGRCDNENPSDAEFNELALELFRMQYESVHPYRRWCQTRRVSPSAVLHWEQIPAIPTAAFREQDMTCLEPAGRTAFFYSSGTTAHWPSRHWHNGASLKLYESSLLSWFVPHLLPDVETRGSSFLRWLVLCPPPALAPHSSLAYMLGTVTARFGPGKTVFAGRPGPDNTWVLDIEAAYAALERSQMENTPTCILATAIHCVELLGHMERDNYSLRLPAGSRLMETGGYKGRSHTLSKDELIRNVSRTLGIPPAYCVSEYGMAELSSQAYDSVAGLTESGTVFGGDGTRCFRFPPWARISSVSPETGLKAENGEPGLLRVYDLANVYSVMAIQTDDLVVLKHGGFEFIGRRTGSERRGCSLMAQ
ncbi:MAG: hypothetical protein N3G20_04340 [Verrucomicrobiae bacterium]|nr:hypothetical protein [Verrucomicrobiae bacterium]